MSSKSLLQSILVLSIVFLSINVLERHCLAQQFREPVITSKGASNNAQDRDFNRIQNETYLEPAVINPSGRFPFESYPLSVVGSQSDDGYGLVPVNPNDSSVWSDQQTDSLENDPNAIDEETLSMLRSRKVRAKKPTVDIDQMEVIRTRYPNGKVQILRHVSQDTDGNYFNNGVWRLFNQRGQILAEGQFTEGLMEGRWKRWHPASSDGLFQTKPFNMFQGPFLSSASFTKGKLNGVWEMFDSNQQKILEIPYKNGKRNGTAIWWFPQSLKMRQVNFREGVVDGPLAEWDSRKKLVRREEYIEGRKVIRQTTMYRPKQKESEVFYLDASMKLTGGDNWWDAQPAKYELDGERIQHGPVNAWYANGQRKMQGQFIDGKRMGAFTWWHPNGQRSCSGLFDADMKQGIWTWWHSNGVKSTRVSFVDNETTGILTEWNERGQVISNQPAGNSSTDELQKPNNQTEQSNGSNLEMLPPTEGFDEVENPTGDTQLPPDDDEDPGLDESDDDDKSTDEFPDDLNDPLNGSDDNAASIHDAGTFDDERPKLELLPSSGPAFSVPVVEPRPLRRL